MRPKNEIKSKEYTAIFAASMLCLFFLLGWANPEKWWGIHFFNFVTPGFAILIFSTIVLLLLLAMMRKDQVLTPGKTGGPDKSRPVVFVVSIIAATLFYSAPIAGDIYGNSRGFESMLHETVQVLPANFSKRLFSFEFVPGNGRAGVQMIIEFISYALSITIYDAFKLLDAFCGSVFVGLWLQSIYRYIHVRNWQLILGAVGIFAPFLLIYFGHVETYAPIYLILAIWLLLYVRYIREPSGVKYWVLLILLIIGVRLHTLMYLLVPAFIVASIIKLGSEQLIKEKLPHLKSIFTRLYVPLLVCGLILYFFVFEDYKDPRALKDFEDIDRLFLPLISPPAPLDNYNLFSVSHLLDFFNIILFWSPGLLVLIVHLVISKRHTLSWAKIELNMILLTAALFGTFLFAMNPLFSMPMDWDLFCFPVPILLIASLLMVEQIQKQPMTLGQLYAMLAATLLSIPTFITFLSKTNNSYRTEQVAIHIYKTYYEHASTYMLMSLHMIDEPDVYNERLENIINQLEPYALNGQDQQYAELLLDKAYTEMYAEKDAKSARETLLQSMKYYKLEDRFEKLAYDINVNLIRNGYVIPDVDKQKAAEIVANGKNLLREKKDYEGALREFRYSRYYDPLSGEAIMYSVEALFRLQRYAEAYEYTLDLVALKYPNEVTSLRIGIHTALEADKYNVALRYTEAYLKINKEDETIQKVHEALVENKNVKELKYLFDRGN